MLKEGYQKTLIMLKEQKNIIIESIKKLSII